MQTEPISKFTNEQKDQALVNIKTMRKISPNYVCFSKSPNFIIVNGVSLRDSFLYSPRLRPYCDFTILGNLPVDLHLIFEKSSLKNQVRRTNFLIYFKLDIYCLCSLQKSNSKQTKKSSSKINLLNQRFQKSSSERQGEGLHEKETKPHI